MTIGTRITERRKELQMSQEDMADRIGVSRQAVSKWETDASAPDAFNLIELAKILDTSVEYIVTGNVEPQKEAKPLAPKDAQNEKGSRRSNLAILGFILAAGGFIFGIIGLFFSFIWSIIGAFIVATGCIFACVKSKKGFAIAFPILAVLIAVTVVLLTV